MFNVLYPSCRTEESQRNLICFPFESSIDLRSIVPTGRTYSMAFCLHQRQAVFFLLFACFDSCCRQNFPLRVRKVSSNYLKKRAKDLCFHCLTFLWYFLARVEIPPFSVPQWMQYHAALFCIAIDFTSYWYLCHYLVYGKSYVWWAAAMPYRIADGELFQVACMDERYRFIYDDFSCRAFHYKMYLRLIGNKRGNNGQEKQKNIYYIFKDLARSPCFFILCTGKKMYSR